MQNNKYIVYSTTPEDDDCGNISMCDENNFNHMKKIEKTINPEVEVEIKFTIEAATSEEANAIFNLRRWGTIYTPLGKSEICPKCDEYYYFPKGSGDCPKCGNIC